jgi:N-acetylglutamate synthase-like GNAT family acetyltransferase
VAQTSQARLEFQHSLRQVLAVAGRRTVKLAAAAVIRVAVHRAATKTVTAKAAEMSDLEVPEATRAAVPRVHLLETKIATAKAVEMSELEVLEATRAVEM